MKKIIITLSLILICLCFALPTAQVFNHSIYFENEIMTFDHIILSALIIVAPKAIVVCYRMLEFFEKRNRKMINNHWNYL